MIISAMAGKPLPVYGTGSQIRDWLYVDDHVDALLLVLERGLPGETYAIGGNCEKTNIEIVHGICSLLEELIPEQKIPKYFSQYNELITLYKIAQAMTPVMPLMPRKLARNSVGNQKKIFQAGAKENCSMVSE